jgi:mono/diheme cytochrome c family protein
MIKFLIIRQTTFISGMGSVAAIALLAAATLTVAPRSAQAFPAYAQKTGITCGGCHVNAAGGGKLTAFGTKWFTGGMKVPAKLKK